MESVIDKKWCVIVNNGSNEFVTMHNDKESALYETAFYSEKFSYEERKNAEIIIGLADTDIFNDYICACDEKGSCNVDLFENIDIKYIFDEF